MTEMEQALQTLGNAATRAEARGETHYEAGFGLGTEVGGEVEKYVVVTATVVSAADMRIRTAIAEEKGYYDIQQPE